jgi:cytochrome b
MTVSVWDPLLRLFHWGLVAAFAVAWLTTDEGRALHETAGYIAAGLIAFRLVWGMIGPRYARLSQFIRGPRTVIGYVGSMILGRERRYLGHNPAGAVMIVALLVSLSGMIYTGWVLVEPSRMAMLPAAVTPALAEEGEGGSRGEGEEGSVKDLHGALAYLTLLLVVLHIAGVDFASLRHHENPTRSMLLGRNGHRSRVTLPDPATPDTTLLCWTADLAAAVRRLSRMANEGGAPFYRLCQDG